MSRRTHGLDIIVKNDKIMKPICPYCGKKFNKERGLIVHIGMMHGDNNRAKGKNSQ